LGGDPKLKASNGWLRNFKAGHGIHDLKIHREKMSAKTESADFFFFQISKQKLKRHTTVMTSCTLLMKLACTERLFFKKLQL
jgi:hypothetical protein